MSARPPEIRIVVVALALAAGGKLLMLAVMAMTLGFEQARVLLFPGTGLVLAAIAYPLVRRRMTPR
jgi:hypothetical protein